MNTNNIKNILQSKRNLNKTLQLPVKSIAMEAEGGCGVVGFCCTEPVPGKHIHEPSRLMHNRGNGKGGGIAAVGFVPEQLGVSREVLDDCYMLHIAFLDPSARPDVEKKYVDPVFDIKKSAKLDTVDDWKSVPGLEVKPPDVYRYFVRVKDSALSTFISENTFANLDRRDVEDEFVNQNSFKLNHEFYVSAKKQTAFVMSQGRNIMILKVVGYAEAVTQYYKIDDLRAHVWIAHQRYPTRGRVWHPGGAHPFTAMNMALVHNGDFANYHSVTEYLKQRNIYPQFITDTEVSAQMFDLLSRIYKYPVEYIIEAFAPTTELDFDRLPNEKQEIYRAIQSTHMHGSPDGPWFFIIARNLIENRKFQLLGITDTAMLRPQVFAFVDGEVQVGIIGSEKQAIDATLESLAKDDKRICPIADKYWNARGGSYSDGGAFMFDIVPDNKGNYRLECKDKFGNPVVITEKTESCDFTKEIPDTKNKEQIGKIINEYASAGKYIFEFVRDNIPQWSFDDIRTACRAMRDLGKNNEFTSYIIDTLTLLNDRHYLTGAKRRSHILQIIRAELNSLFMNIPRLRSENDELSEYRFVDFETRSELREPKDKEKTLVVNSKNFPPEGSECDAMYLVRAYKLGWKNFILFHCAGQRYVGCGFGPETHDLTIDVYGSSGDYLGSGIDGMTLTVHGNAQDQLGQIIKQGKLVIHGDVGQTFLYGAKGGSIFVKGNAAGRPMINSVGRPRIVINGTSLDFLGESFMAGDPHNKGGFVILNGMKFNEEGQVVPLPEPYPGSNLFSLASGGAAFIRDPKRQLISEQLNGCIFSPFTEKDWELILPYLTENEKLFGIKLDDLLTVNGKKLNPMKVYRKVSPSIEGTPSTPEQDVYGEEEEVDELAEEVLE
ncbi:MAG: glutamate synthase [Bacteroidota bacterium]|jgi:glutamate synthase domain-containing protein 1/glutamate synthase domain-containing protein 3